LGFHLYEEIQVAVFFLIVPCVTAKENNPFGMKTFNDGFRNLLEPLSPHV